MHGHGEGKGTVPTPTLQRHPASPETVWVLHFRWAIVLWHLVKLSHLIMFSLNRASSISGTFVLTSCL